MVRYQGCSNLQPVRDRHCGSESAKQELIMPSSNGRTRTYLQGLELLIPRDQGRKIVREVLILAKLHLDETLDFKDQDKTEVDRLIVLVCRKYPVFRRFTDEWPLRYMLRDHFRRRKTPVKRNIMPHVAGAVDENQIPTAENARDTRNPDQMDYGPAPCPMQKQSGRCMPHRTVRRDILMPAHQSSPVLSNGKDGADFVKTFLEKAELYDAKLLDIFKELGVHNEVALRNVARWTRERDDSPLKGLYDCGKITWYVHERLRELFGKGEV
ncbi:hypothetical protein NEOLEDRAFT_1129740 [Neolentinus lepideus HHB14362 ss-1]|uniref:Uncharacterized protein n=1 Tax=Neolentinus lepideus HHB14362 ss-1 TaxID=1314782 RepID=A0A165ULB2_9AGAM|nr:hypothetical protein NEOLEDRAFT_1129740 [Neolentinus lepideus HHB14362 ss-1]